MRSRSESRASRTAGCIDLSSQQVATDDTASALESFSAVITCGSCSTPTFFEAARTTPTRAASAWSACARVRHVTHLDVGHLFAWTGCVDHLPIARVHPTWLMPP